MAKGKDKEAPPPEGAAAEGAEGEAPAKKKPPLIVLIAAGVGALVVLGGGGVGAMMFLGKKPPAEGAEHGKEAKDEHGKEGAKEGEAKPVGQVAQGPDGVVFYTLPDLVVNIQTADSRPTFLKLKLAFELPDESVVEELEPNAPRLADMFQTFLRELRPEDLSGSQGSYQLRMEIQRRVNLVIAPSKVNAVLIQEMLIQ